MCRPSQLMGAGPDVEGKRGPGLSLLVEDSVLEQAEGGTKLCRVEVRRRSQR